MPRSAASALSVVVDPWFDLVYHALSHLPVAAADASSLYDTRYVQWAERHLLGREERPDAPARTLPSDAPLLAQLYDASKQGFLLHAFPLLWSGIGEFCAAMGTDWPDLSWADPDLAAQAEAMRAQLHPALPDLFRTALWTELANGFGRAWRRVVALRSRAYRAVFVKLTGPLAERLPGLAEVEWVLCHPLRVHGRALGVAAEPPTVAVGVRDAALGVTQSHPVVQGCHEFFVWRAQRDAAGAGGCATVPGREGHGAFAAVEHAALAAGARFFRGSDFEAAYFEWLSLLFPGAAPSETALRLAADT